jgi:hypothetical protein
MKMLLIHCLLIFSTQSWARSIKPSLDRVGTELYQVAAGIGVISLMIASIYLMSGKNDAGEKITKNFIGLFLCATSMTIVAFFMGLR